MKKILFQILLFATIFPVFAFGSINEKNSAAPMGTIPFITTWKTDNPGDTNDDQIRISVAIGSTYNYDIDWGDGNTTNGETGDATHTYNTPGTYTIRITGLFPRITFGTNDDAEKLLSIEQWGNNEWTSMSNAFDGCRNMVGNFTDVPDLSNVTDMSWMFANCRSFNTDINNWDVSNVTDISYLFYWANSYNQPLNNWVVSSVTNLQSTFSLAESFNQNINNWIVDNVLSMQNTFTNAEQFNQPLDNWTVTQVTNMRSMFSGAERFNQDISGWIVSGVTDMRNMFNRAENFNQNISNWNVSNVTDMQGMFSGADVFNQDVSSWLVDNVTDMSRMFYLTENFNQDISTWNTANVTDMTLMFGNTDAFDQDLGDWDLGNVTNATNMFRSSNLSNANYDAILIGWNSQTLQPNVSFGAGDSKYCLGAAARANMENTFGWTITDGGSAGPIFNPLGNQTQVDSYTLPAITGTQLTGNEAYYIATNGGGTRYDIGDVINFADFPNYPVTLYIYDYSSSCSSEENFNLTLTNAANADAFVTTWQTTRPNEEITIPTTGSGYNYTVDWGDGNTTTGETGNATHTYVTSGIYTVSITGDFPRIYFNTNGNPTATDNSAKILTIEQWGTNPWTSMFKAFTGCINLTGNFSDIPDLSNVTNTAGMFATCRLFNSDIDNWDMSTVTSISFMFQNNASFNQPLNSWNVSNVIDMSLLFQGAIIFNQPLDNWNVSNVTNLSSAFSPASAFDQNLGNWNVENVTNADRMFNSATLSTANYDALLIGWNARNLQPNVLFSGGGSQYCEGETARANMIASDGWVITDDGIAGPTITDLADQTSGDSYTLPAITGTQLTGTEAYFTETGGGGTRYEAGNTLNFIDFPSYPVTLYIYDGSGSCTSEENFELTLTSIGTVPNACADLANPLADATDVAVDVGSISWDTVTDATTYRVSVNGSTSNANDITNQDFNTTSYTLPSDFDNDETVTVTIVPFNAVGDAVGCVTQSFTIASLTPTVPSSCANLTSPMDGATNVAIDIAEISWDAVTDATAYRVSVNGSTSTVNDTTNQDFTGTSFTLPGNFDNAETVSVIIIPFNDAGDALGCDTPQTFTIIGASQTVIPQCTELVPELNGTTDVAVATSISWNEVNSADGYFLSVRTDSGEILLTETDLGMLTTYSLPEDLPFSTTILVSITPYNSEGRNDSCSELSFVTIGEMQEPEEPEEPIEPVEEDNTKYGFSPDGDGINEFWEIDGIEIYPENTVTIYNRWGDLVFQVEGYDNAANVFNGQANQKTKMGASKLPSGTYFFNIQIDGDTILRKTQGFLVLKR